MLENNVFARAAVQIVMNIKVLLTIWTGRIRRVSLDIVEGFLSFRLVRTREPLLAVASARHLLALKQNNVNIQKKAQAHRLLCPSQFKSI